MKLALLFLAAISLFAQNSVIIRGSDGEGNRLFQRKYGIVDLRCDGCTWENGIFTIPAGGSSTIQYNGAAVGSGSVVDYIAGVGVDILPVLSTGKVTVQPVIDELVWAKRSYVDSVASAGPKATWLISPTQGVGAAGTQYVSSSLAPSGTEGARYWVSAATGTIRNFYIGLLSSQTGDGACVCNVRVNGVDSSVSVTIPASASFGTVMTPDTTHTVAVTAGQRVAIKCVNASASASATFTASLEVW